MSNEWQNLFIEKLMRTHKYCHIRRTPIRSSKILEGITSLPKIRGYSMGSIFPFLSLNYEYIVWLYPKVREFYSFVLKKLKIWAVIQLVCDSFDSNSSKNYIYNWFDIWDDKIFRVCLLKLSLSICVKHFHFWWIDSLPNLSHK